MNSKKIREEIAEVQDRLDALNTLVEKEDRGMTEDETKTFDEDLANFERLSNELKKVEKFEKLRAEAARNVAPVTLDVQKESKEEKEAVRDFSFGDAVRAAYTGKLDGLAREMHEEGEKEMARIGKEATGIVVPSMILNRAVATENDTTGIETQSFVQGVYANTILGQLGVTQLNAITDQRVPIIPSVTTQWEGETDNAADGMSALSKVDLAPIRLASYLDYSKQAAMQHNQSLEAALRQALQEAVAAKVEYACFTDDSGNGAFNYLGNGKTAVTAATVTALVLAVMEEVQSNNHSFGNLGFAISNDLFAEVHQAVLATGVSPLVANDLLMGRTFGFSTQIADIAVGQESIYYGNWSKVQIAQFGGIEIMVDPYTQAVGGKHRLHLNSYWDMALVQDAAISVGGYTG